MGAVVCGSGYMDEIDKKLPNPITDEEIELAIEEGRFAEANRMIINLYILHRSDPTFQPKGQILY